MDDKQLTNQQSLDLIARMISDTRRNFNEKGRLMFHVTSYTTIAVTLAVYFALRLTGSHHAMWIWAGLPLLNWAIMIALSRKHESRVRTHLDKTVGSLTVGGFAAMALSFLTLLFPEAQYFIFAGIFLVAWVIPGHMLSHRCKIETGRQS